MVISKFKKIFWSCLNDYYFNTFVYLRQFRRTINLNKPETLNEKILWLKVFNKDPLQTLCSDKYSVREYVKNKIGEEYLVDLIGVYDDINDITLESLPDIPFIIKANHTSGTFKIVYDKSNLDIEELRSNCKQWLSSNYYFVARESQYKDIKPCVIVERLLLDNGSIPSDLKFICINGKVEMINVDSNKEVQHLRNNYDGNWNALDFRWPKEYFPGPLIPKSKHLNALINLAETLAVDFDFVRVDFYIIGHKIYFGELTFHPTSGLGEFSDFKYDEFYGEKLKITNRSMRR